MNVFIYRIHNIQFNVMYIHVQQVQIITGESFLDLIQFDSIQFII